MSAVGFQRLTGINISEFFEDFSSFISTYYDNIVGYYQGRNELESGAVEELKRLISLSDRIEDVFSNSTEVLSSNTSMYDLYEDFTDVHIKLGTVKNTPKWTKSFYKNDYDRNTNIDYILKQKQSIEGLSQDLGFEDPQNDWVDLAVRNKISEVDYSLDGGNLLSVSFAVNSNINTVSAVDVMTGNNVLGKDLPRLMQIFDEDLLTLSPLETLNQSSEILIQLQKGDIPETPTLGVPSTTVGSNLAMLRYPSVFREIASSYRTDDAFKEVSLRDVRQGEDSVSLDITIVSKLNDVLNQTLVS